MRPVWELLNSKLGKYVAPSEYLTIDETLYPMRHQIAFRQYNPNKPHKHSVLLKSLNDARFPYTDKALPYAAKPTAGDGPFYISSTADYIKNLVIRTKEQVKLDGRNISMDRLYTSVEITNWLLEKNITIVGTVQKGRVDFPEEVFETKNREVLSKTCHFEKDKKDLCLSSYTVQTKSEGKKKVVILSTTRPLHSCTKDDNKSKPQIFKFYNFTKGGADIVDQINDHFITRVKSLRWVMIVLYYMQDTARVNTKTIWCIKNGIDHHKLKPYNFGWDLAKTPTMPHVIRRDVNGLGLMVQLKRNLFLGTAFVVPEPKPKIEKRFECTAKRKKCVIHQENCRTKQEKDNCPRSNEQCHSCGDSICRELSLRLCVKCLE